MARVVAFLRGINVGGHRVKMDGLRRRFVAMKLRDVTTFIASGNVIFTTAAGDAARLERRIESDLQEWLGYAVPTMVRTLPDLAVVAAQRPFAPADMENPANSLNVLFLRKPLTSAVESAVRALDGATDEFRVRDRELFWLCRGKISVDSVAAPLLGKALAGAEGTVRNLRTVRQIVALHGS